MLKRIIAILSLCLSLQGCLFVAGAAIGVGVVGAVVYDRRTAQETQQDKVITEQIQLKLNNAPEIKEQSKIVVASFYDVVLLAGTVPNPAMKEQAYALAKTVPGIKKLYNEIIVEGSASGLSSFNDSLITTKIKTQLVGDNDLNSSQIQVVTVNGIVYLMGRVTPRQADIAVDIVQHISGVTKVVKVFEYPNNQHEWA